MTSLLGSRYPALGYTSGSTRRSRRPTDNDLGGAGGAIGFGLADISFGYRGYYLLCLEGTQRSEHKRPDGVGVLELCWKVLMVERMYGAGPAAVGAHGSLVVDPHNLPGVLVGSDPVVIDVDGWR